MLRRVKCDTDPPKYCIYDLSLKDRRGLLSAVSYVYISALIYEQCP
jgi:hypothetical protein